MSIYINPKWIITDFLRSKLIDPRISRRPTLKTLEITATASQTTFDLEYTANKSLSYISEVLVDSVLKKKWQDYYINFRNNQIVFFDGLTAGQELVIKLYETSTDWIYWDTLNENLKPEQYPRITVLIAAGSGSRLGNFKAPIEYVMNVQFDVFCKEKSSTQIFEIAGKNYTGEELAEIIAYDIQEVFESNIEDLHPVMYDYEPSQFPPRSIPFDESLNCHRKILECQLSSISVGRV